MCNVWELLFIYSNKEIIPRKTTLICRKEMTVKEICNIPGHLMNFGFLVFTKLNPDCYLSFIFCVSFYSLMPGKIHPDVKIVPIHFFLKCFSNLKKFQNPHLQISEYLKYEFFTLARLNLFQWGENRSKVRKKIYASVSFLCYATTFHSHIYVQL